MSAERSVISPDIRGRLRQHGPDILTASLRRLQDDARVRALPRSLVVEHLARALLQLSGDALQSQEVDWPPDCEASAVCRVHDVLAEAVFAAFAAEGSVPLELLADLNERRVSALETFSRRVSQRDTAATPRAWRFAAHELRSPLMAAVTAATLLQRRVDAASDPSLQLLLRSLARLRELADQLATGELTGAEVPADLPG